MVAYLDDRVNKPFNINQLKLKIMQQKRKLNRVMESGNHFKNRTSLKKMMSKGNDKMKTLI